MNKDIKTEMTITAPEGMQIDQEAFKNSKIEFIPIKKKLPQSWEELENVGGYWIGTNSGIIPRWILGEVEKTDRNLIPTKKLAEAFLALMQLMQLVYVYNDGWEPDYTDGTTKFIIYNYEGIPVKRGTSGQGNVLTFKTEELRDEFLNAPKIKELINIALPLI